jgi:hypothetical protein
MKSPVISSRKNGVALVVRNAFSAVAIAALTLSAIAATPAENPETPAPRHERQAPSVEQKLRTFDTLDFDVFSNQKWERLHESHAKDITVTWPDGHETKGIDRHIDDLKELFVFAPDIQIKTHPIRFGSGSFTGVTGVMTGTFTGPCRPVTASSSNPRASALP